MRLTGGGQAVLRRVPPPGKLSAPSVPSGERRIALDDLIEPAVEVGGRQVPPGVEREVAGAVVEHRRNLLALDLDDLHAAGAQLVEGRRLPVGIDPLEPGEQPGAGLAEHRAFIVGERRERLLVRPQPERRGRVVALDEEEGVGVGLKGERLLGIHLDRVDRHLLGGAVRPLGEQLRLRAEHVGDGGGRIGQHPRAERGEDRELVRVVGAQRRGDPLVVGGGAQLPLRRDEKGAAGVEGVQQADPARLEAGVEPPEQLLRIEREAQMLVVVVEEGQREGRKAFVKLGHLRVAQKGEVRLPARERVGGRLPGAHVYDELPAAQARGVRRERVRLLEHDLVQRVGHQEGQHPHDPHRLGFLRPRFHRRAGTEQRQTERQRQRASPDFHAGSPPLSAARPQPAGTVPLVRRLLFLLLPRVLTGLLRFPGLGDVRLEGARNEYLMAHVVDAPDVVGGADREGIVREDQLVDAVLPDEVDERELEIPLVDDIHLVVVVDQKGREGVAERLLDDQNPAPVADARLDLDEGEIPVQEDGIAVGALRVLPPEGAVHPAVGGVHQKPLRLVGLLEEIVVDIVGVLEQGGVLRLGIHRPNEIVEPARLKIAQLLGRQPRLPAERPVSVIGAQARPVVVGAEVDILVRVRRELRIGVHLLDRRVERPVDEVDHRLLGLGEVAVFVRDVELDRRGDDHVVDLNVGQLLMVGVEHLRVPLPARRVAPVKGHRHPPVDEGAARDRAGRGPVVHRRRRFGRGGRVGLGFGRRGGIPRPGGRRLGLLRRGGRLVGGVGKVLRLAARGRDDAHVVDAHAVRLVHDGGKAHERVPEGEGVGVPRFDVPRERPAPQRLGRKGGKPREVALLHRGALGLGAQQRAEEEGQQRPAEHGNVDPAQPVQPLRIDAVADERVIPFPLLLGAARARGPLGSGTVDIVLFAVLVHKASENRGFPRSETVIEEGVVALPDQLRGADDEQEKAERGRKRQQDGGFPRVEPLGDRALEPFDGRHAEKRRQRHPEDVVEQGDLHVAVPAARARKAEHDREVSAELAKVGEVEDHPAGRGEQQQVEVPEHRRHPVEQVPEEEPLERDERAVVEPPEDEVPARAVPEPGQQPHGQQVEILVLPVAAERDVDVIPEEAREGDVPPPPELGGGAGDIGVVKVLLIVEAEHPPQPDGHVGVAGEVVIDLQSEHRRAEPRPADREARGGGQQELVREGARGVGDEHLFRQPEADPRQPLREGDGVGRPRGDLPCHVGVAHDGARHQLVVHRQVEQVIDGVGLRPGVPAVDVDDVGDRLEGVEGDADGQRESGHRKGGAQQGVQVLDEKAAVLEGAEQPEVERQRGGERRLGRPGPPVALDQPSVHVVERGGGQQQQEPHRLAPGVEQEGKRHQHQVAVDELFRKKVKEDIERQEQVDEQQICKNHAALLQRVMIGIIIHSFSRKIKQFVE